MAEDAEVTAAMTDKTDSDRTRDDETPSPENETSPRNNETSSPDGESSAGEPADSRATSGDQPPIGVSPTVKSSLLWGVVGGLSFLVLVQGYRLFADLGIGIGAILVVAVMVAFGAAVVTYATRGRLSVENENP